MARRVKMRARRAVKMRRWQQNQRQHARSRKVIIPDDIIFVHILPLLPVFSLVRCQCVCKSWHTLLKQSQFLKDYHRRHCQILTITTTLKPYTPRFQSFTYDADHNNLSIMQTHTPPPDPKAKIVASCNGYILFKVRTRSLEYQQYFLWNPTTSASVVLPPRPCTHINAKDYLKFVFSGLGYDPISEDYKVVLIRSTVGVTYTQIYSLKTSRWNTIFEHIPYPLYDHPSTRSGVYVCGCLHWATYFLDTSRYFVSFNVAKETFKAIPLPDYCKYFESCCLDGMLCMVGLVEMEWELWVMKEYGVKESWTRLMSLSLISQVKIRPVCLTYNGRVILQYGCNIVSYDLKAKSRKSSTLVGGNMYDPLVHYCTVLRETT